MGVLLFIWGREEARLSRRISYLVTRVEVVFLLREVVAAVVSSMTAFKN